MDDDAEDMELSCDDETDDVIIRDDEVGTKAAAVVGALSELGRETEYSGKASMLMCPASEEAL